MAIKVTFKNGKSVTFANRPSQSDIDEAESSVLGTSQIEPDEPSSLLGRIATGIGTGVGSTFRMAKKTVEAGTPAIQKSLKPRQDLDFGTLGGIVKAGTELLDPRSILPTIDTASKKPLTEQVSDIATKPLVGFEQKRNILETAGQQTRQTAEKAVGNIVEDTSRLARKYLPKPLADIVETGSSIAGGTFLTLSSVAPFTPLEFGAEGAGALLGAVPSGVLAGVPARQANRFLNVRLGLGFLVLKKASLLLVKNF